MSDAVDAGPIPASPAAPEHKFSELSARSITSLLEARIVRLLPTLTRADCVFAIAHVRAGLVAMVRDEAARIRGVMEEAVDPTAQPPGVQPIESAEAVELLLPVLTDADLVYLLASPSSPHGAASHAARPAILSLLADGSASIREAVLDALLGSAEHRDPRAAALSSQAGQSLSEIAAGYALEVLTQSEDFPAPLRAEMTAQIEPERREGESDEAIVATIRGLKAANALTESTLLRAAQRSELRRVAAILAIASGVPLAAVDRACWLRSAKGLVALAWKSGFTMRSALVAQSVLGQLSPSNRLLPTKDGGFPLEKAEMEWQIELLRSLLSDDLRRAA